MSYIVIKIVKGRRYRYLQTSWREGKHVRTKSICLGALDGGRRKLKSSGIGGLGSFLKAQRLSPEDRALAAAERQAAKVDKHQREMFGETAVERKAREEKERSDRIYTNIGLTPPSGMAGRHPTHQSDIQPATLCETPRDEDGTIAEGDSTSQ